MGVMRVCVVMLFMRRLCVVMRVMRNYALFLCIMRGYVLFLCVITRVVFEPRFQFQPPLKFMFDDVTSLDPIAQRHDLGPHRADA